MLRALHSADIPVRMLVLGAAIIVALAFTHANRARAMRVGDPLPALALLGLDGIPATERPSAGTTIYNVFATWCGPCRDETPLLREASRRMRARGIRVVGIDRGETPAAVRAFVDHYRLQYPVLIDPDATTNARLGDRVIPETLVVRDGVVRAQYVGPLDRASLAKLTDGD